MWPVRLWEVPNGGAAWGGSGLVAQLSCSGRRLAMRVAPEDDPPSLYGRGARGCTSWSWQNGVMLCTMVTSRGMLGIDL